MNDPQIELREAQQYLGIRDSVTDGVPAFADKVFPELFGWLGEHGIQPAGPPFIRYRELGRAGEPLEIEVGVPVGPEVAGIGDGRVRPDALPAGRYLTLLHVGPYRSDSMPDLGDARAELLGFAEDNGLVHGRESERGFAPLCALEHYLVGPVEEPDFTKWRTEFAYLIA
jgi:effector-binding domain-containing protein